MADEDKASKKHAASPKKKRDAKKRGQVARSQDVSVVFGLAAGLGTLFIIATVGEPSLGSKWLVGYIRFVIDSVADPNNVEIMPLIWRGLLAVAIITGPVFLAVMIMGLVANIGQVGLIFTGEQLKPKLDKINPMKGIKRWFAIRSLVELSKSLIKIGVALIMGYWIWTDYALEIATSVLLDPAALLALGGKMIKDLVWKILVLFLVIAVLDFMFQRWQWARDLKMSDKELRDEYKQMEGDPYMKGRRRQIHQQMSQQLQSRENTPTSDVVVINPTQIAIGLRYDPDTDASPMVVAKGEKRQADEIRELAIKSGIPVVRNQPLARELNERCELGGEIPADLFRPVAEVLAYVFALADGEARSASDAAMEAAHELLGAVDTTSHQHVPALTGGTQYE